MYRYLEAEGSVDGVGAETLRRFCEGSNAAIEWLEAHGDPCGGNVFEEKAAFPAGRLFPVLHRQRKDAGCMGGLVLDGESGAVRRGDGRLIGGLYAAGRAAAGRPAA